MIWQQWLLKMRPQRNPTLVNHYPKAASGKATNNTVPFTSRPTFVLEAQTFENVAS